MTLSQIQELNFRKLYDINQLLSDIGGVGRVLIFTFGIALFPISEFAYIRNISKHIYLASTVDDKLFKECKNKNLKILKWTNEDRIPKYYNHKMKKEVRKHRVARLYSKDEILLFLNYILEPVLPSSCLCKSKKRDKLLTLYKESKKKLEKDLNIIKLVHSVT